MMKALGDFPLTQRKVIARRSAQFILPQEHVVNYGMECLKKLQKC